MKTLPCQKRKRTTVNGEGQDKVEAIGVNEGTAAEIRAWMKPRWTSATAEKQHDNFAIPLPTRTLKLKWGCSSGEASNEHDLSKSREKLHGLAHAGDYPPTLLLGGAAVRKQPPGVAISLASAQSCMCL